MQLHTSTVSAFTLPRIPTKTCRTIAIAGGVFTWLSLMSVAATFMINDPAVDYVDFALRSMGAAALCLATAAVLFISRQTHDRNDAVAKEATNRPALLTPRALDRLCQGKSAVTILPSVTSVVSGGYSFELPDGLSSIDAVIKDCHILPFRDLSHDELQAAGIAEREALCDVFRSANPAFMRMSPVTVVTWEPRGSVYAK